MECFWELSTTRALGFGVMGPIPWHMIILYARHKGFTDEQSVEVLKFFIRELDAEYLRHQAAEAQKRGGAKS